MIIGVSGHIGSGKDTVGKIIQYLITKSKFPTLEFSMDGNFEIDAIGGDLPTNTALESGWQIKKFAYAVKQVCSILTGIPVEDFEKEEVKNSVLGEEWIRYGYADGFYRYIAGSKQGDTILDNKQCSKERYEEELKINWQTAYKHQYTVRELLQLVGTNAIRNVIHEDAWVNALMNQYGIRDIEYFKAFPDNYKLPNWIITDVRFPNEAKAIKDRGGIIIKIKSPFVRFSDGSFRARNKMMGDYHSSETALDNYDFDYVIDNNNTIDDLITNVDFVLKMHNIL